MVILQSADNENYTVDLAVAQRSQLIKNMLEDIGESDQPIPIPNVSGRVLKKIIEYCEHHKDEPLPEPDDKEEDYSRPRNSDDIEPWDRTFIGNDKEEIFDIILAANYMDIKPLLDLGCKTIANMIKGKTPQEIRDLFGIENDFTPEEEEQIRKENEWAEERM